MPSGMETFKYHKMEEIFGGKFERFKEIFSDGPFIIVDNSADNPCLYNPS